MKRIITLLAVLLQVHLCGPLAAVASAAQRPNIILCMTDDQGWGDVSYNGLTKIKTPNIDALAAAGLRFNRFYAQQSCSPKRASVMTGRHPNRMAVFWPGMPLRKQEVTIAQVAKQAGYATGNFGKWHLNGVAGPGKVMPDSDPLSPRNCGFDESFSVSNYFETDATFGRNGVAEKTTGDGSDVIVGEALKFIRQNAEKQQPTLTVIWFGSPHAPHQPLPADLAAAGGSGYFGEMLGVDRSIGTLRAGLRELGVADDTLLWFNSDNGGWHNVAKDATQHKDFANVPVTSNAPLRSGKASNYEGGTRVPLLAVWPGKIAPGSTSDTLAQSTDFFPTLLELLQLPTPAGVKFDGASIAPALRGQPVARDTIFSHFPHGGRSDIEGFRPGTWVRRGAWKLIRFFADNEDGTDKLELYNLQDDLGETKNLAAEKAAHAGELNALITGFLKDSSAVIPIRNPAWKADETPAADPLLSWKARGCTAAVQDGIVTITGSTADPFLGFAAGQLAAGAKLRLRIKSSGGTGKIEWLPGGKPDAATAPPPVPFEITGGDWTEVSAAIPAPGEQPGILRLHLPASEHPVSVDWIELTSDVAKPRRWDF